MAGIVGRERYQFDIWGDTVNVANRLAGVASPATVALTEEMAALLPGAAVLSRGAVELKGKGSVRMVEVTEMSQNASV
jgi:guanylate cyclase